jgi:putative DNA primase/helicase
MVSLLSKPIHAKATLSLVTSTQPGRIQRYLSHAVRGGNFDDGLIQRFGLLVWPDISADWTHIDRGPDRSAKAQAMKVFDDLDVLDWRAIGAKRDRGPDGDEEGLPYLRFGIDAYDLFVDWRTPLEGYCEAVNCTPRLSRISGSIASLFPLWRSFAISPTSPPAR